MSWQPCGYGCHRLWWRWPGTELIGHAKCAVPPAFQDELLALLDRFPRLTAKRLAADLGVTVSVLTAWTAAARRRRSA